MIVTLPLTVLIEGVVVLAYCRWRGRPLRSILISSLLVNILTQCLLWAVLQIFFQRYLVVLLVAEFWIWLLEGYLLHIPAPNQLTWKEALFLSLCMNLPSFAVGWFLPV